MKAVLSVAPLHLVETEEHEAEEQRRREAKFAREVDGKRWELRVREEARRQLAGEERAKLPTPEPVSLTELLAEPDEAVVYRIEGLWPSGGHVVMAAPMKSGKTTATGNLVRSLVDGDPFLGGFPSNPVREVVLIDNEMDREQIKRWLRAQGIKNTDRVRVVSLRGKVSTFDLLDPARRAEWAELVRGAEVVVMDCLRPVLDALGLSEDKEAGRFFVAFDALLDEAGVREALVVHHTGHTNERSRGDSRIRDWPDAEWHIVRDAEDDSKPRFFKAFGRDVDVPEGRLAYDSVTRHLSYVAGEDRRNTADPKMVRQVLEYVRDKPGANTNAIKEQLSGNAAEVTACINICRKDYLLVEDGPRRAKLHTLSPTGEAWLTEHIAGGKLVVTP